jgi:hypothetical protein
MIALRASFALRVEKSIVLNKSEGIVGYRDYGSRLAMLSAAAATTTEPSIPKGWPIRTFRRVSPTAGETFISPYGILPLQTLDFRPRRQKVNRHGGWHGSDDHCHGSDPAPPGRNYPLIIQYPQPERSE